MGKKKHDAAQTETEAVKEAVAADAVRPGGFESTAGTEARTSERATDADTGELSMVEDEGSAVRDAADNPAMQGDLVSDGEAAAQVSENQQDPAAPGTGDPDGAGGAAGAAQGSDGADGEEHTAAIRVDGPDGLHGEGTGVAQSAGGTETPASGGDLGDGSAGTIAGAPVSDDDGEAEAEADHTLTNWLADIFTDVPARLNAAVAGMVYHKRAFPISGFAGAAAALVPYYLPDQEVGPIFSHPEAETMAAFVRANPDAPLLAMWKQVELKHKLPATIPNNADMLALTIFHNACQAVLAYEKAEAADQAEREAREVKSPAWHGEQAFQVQAGGFEATGFTPR